MTNFFEEELRKLFGNGEAIGNPVFLGNVCAGTLDGDLRVRAEFAATEEKDEYDALLIRVIHRGGGEIDRLTLRFLDVWGKRPYHRRPQTVEDTEPRVVALANRTDWVGTPDDEDRRILRERVGQYLDVYRRGVSV